MAVHDAALSLRAISRIRTQPLRNFPTVPPPRRHLSTNNATETVDAELESSSTFTEGLPSKEKIRQYKPAVWARGRGKQLPPSRYRFRPPKYYRGPLHPHQPPPESDPASRAFQPGPFSIPRLQETYQSTVESDYMTLTYQHFPPGFRKPEKAQRLREWIGDSPYFKNRPLRGPRGGTVLLPLRKPVTFRNVPGITGVTVNSFVSQANENSSFLHVASMAIQAITNVRCETFKAKKSVVQWEHKRGKYVTVKSKLEGEDAYNFLSKVIDVVMPRIKEYKGVAGTSGDSTGNIGFGFSPEQVATFPEIEFNYDMYPPNMIPGCHVLVHTSATNDRDARLLLQAIGVPFYGKHVD